MADTRPSPLAPAAPLAAGGDAPDAAHHLRQLGARAHQLRAATRAADHYTAQDQATERDTGSWLMSSAVGLAAELAADLDGLARAIKERQADAALLARLSPLRVRTHQLHAAAKAADHFLDQDSREDQDTGSWLVATAHALAVKLAAEMDDSVADVRRSPVNKAAVEVHDPALARRVAAATATASTPLRGAA
ncbi:MAG: hypothetical protein Q8R98_23235 [Rubrivivax sp.]|nr:hypothetical protein [Rubrivivax sp.]MDP3614765.1 hypothetical protein [Rubrivivax sp.]